MSAFKCEKCQSVVAIPTRRWKPRKKNHEKHMWCWRCKQKTKHRML